MGRGFLFVRNWAGTSGVNWWTSWECISTTLGAVTMEKQNIATSALISTKHDQPHWLSNGLKLFPLLRLRQKTTVAFDVLAHVKR